VTGSGIGSGITLKVESGSEKIFSDPIHWVQQYFGGARLSDTAALRVTQVSGSATLHSRPLGSLAPRYSRP